MSYKQRGLNDTDDIQSLYDVWSRAAALGHSAEGLQDFSHARAELTAKPSAGVRPTSDLPATGTSSPASDVTVAAGGAATIAGAETGAVVFDGSSGTLAVQNSQDLQGAVSGLAGSDTIDLADLAFTANTQATFVGTSSGGTLTISNGTETAKITLTGDYLSSTWSVSSDGNGGTNVVDPTVSTNWQVMKVGAGGWADGLDKAADGTIVVRTDTNGAYLWNGSSWQQIVTSNSLPAAFVAADPVELGQGVYEIQMAPSNSSIMYMMFDGYVFASTNKGTTWTQTSFAPVAANPNDNFRMYGQKMAVDPNNPDIVYVGTPQNGLWVTTNGGTTWAKVSAIPVSGTSGGQYPGITGIMFDPEIGGAVNGVTQTIFASSYGNGVYESTNGGSSWTSLAGGPSDVEYAMVGPNGAYYAIGNSNQNLWRYYNGVWTELLAGNGGQGIQAVLINPDNSNEIVAVAQSGYLNVSYDGGTTWSGIDWSIAVKSTDIPWEAAANVSSTNGVMFLTVGGAAFSQSNPNELILSTGTGSFDVTVPTTSLTGTLTYNDMSAGIENLVATEILVAPGEDPILASWDRPFIQITNLDAYPTTYGPVATNTIVAGWSVDYASSTPSFLVGIADWFGVEDSGYSTNGGATWTNFATDIPGAGSSFIGGTIAASTTQNFIWAPADGHQPYYTLNGGQTWNPITLPGVTSWSNFDWAYYLDTRTVTADRVLANTFYMYYPGTDGPGTGAGVFETTNGGQSWTEVYMGALAPWAGNSEIMSAPGEAGNLFFTAGIQGNGTNPPSNDPFMMSTNQGKTWTYIPNVLEVTTFGFGAAAPGQSYPSIYIVGYVNNVFGVWQSTNQGQSWVQIGTQPAGELDQVTTISGDPDVFGRVYVGFSGGGFAYLSGGPYVTGVTTNPSSGAETSGKTVTFTVNMSSAVTVSGGTPTLNLNDGGVATYVSGSGTSALTFSYTVALTDTAVSSLAISSASLGGATVQDTSGNAASLSGAVTTFSGLSVNESSAPAPTVTGVTTNPLSGAEVSGNTVTFTVNMSSAVTVSGGTPTLNLNDGGVAAYTSGSGTSALTFTYTVASTDTAVGSLAISSTSLNGATIQNSSGAAASLSGAVTAFPSLSVVQSAPAATVTGVTTNPASGAEVSGSTVTFTVNMSSAVTVSGGKPTLNLNDGGVATYASGSGTSALTFTYTVASTDTAVGSLAISSTSLNGATIQNSSGVAANLAGAVTTFSGLSVNEFSAPAATVTGVTANPASGAEVSGNTVTFTVNMSKGVAVTGGTPTLNLNDGGVATYVSGSGTSTLTFSYTVASTDKAVSSLAISSVSLNGASIHDSSSTSANLAGAITTFSGLSVAKAADPTVTGVTTNPASGAGVSGNTVTFTVNMSSAVTVSGGKPTLNLNDGGVATYASGSGTSALTFTYTVASTDTAVGSLAISSTSLNGATIQNSSGAAANLAGAITTFSALSVNEAPASAATVTGVTTNPSSGAEKPGDTITFTVNMSKGVAVTGGTPTLNLNDGGVATYVSGSGTSTLTFSYTVASTDKAVSSLAISSVSLNGASIHDSSSTSANLAGAITTFSGLSVTPPVTVAYYLANKSALDAGGTVLISDTAANVASALDTLNADSNVSQITLLGSANLNLNVAQTLNDTHALNAITNSNYGITVTDTGANVSANFDVLNSDSRITTILPIGGSQNLTLTLSQMLNDTHAVSLLDPFVITVTGVAESFDSLATSDISTFSTAGVAQLDSTDSDLSLSLAQREALGAEGISVLQPFSGGTTEVVTYSASGNISSIVYQGITGRAYTSDTVNYGTNGKATTATYSNGMTETWTYNTNGSYSISFAGITEQSYTSYTVNYGTNGEATTATYSNGMIETWTYSANGSYSISFAGITGQSYTSYTVNYGTNGKAASATYSNGMTETWTYNANGSYSISFAGITGQSYTSYTVNYGTNGKAASATFSNGMTETWTYNANGSYSVSFAGITGQSYTSYTVNYGTNGKAASATYSNGMTETWTYNANGSYSISFAGITGQSYTSYTVNYGTNGKAASATFSNGMTETWTYNADGSYNVVGRGVTGSSYTGFDSVYTAAEAKVASAFDMTNGSGSLSLVGAGLKVSSGAAGALSLSEGADTFTLDAHATESVNATGCNSELFGFAAGFGHTSIAGFTAGGSDGDKLSLQLSMFNGLSAANTAAQDAAILLSSHAMAQSGSNVTISDLGGDVLTLTGVTTAALIQNASSIFAFH